MSDLNVTTISNSNIAKTDKLLAFNNSDSKAATIQDVVQLVPGVMAVATCSTAGNVATKAVTCDDWNNKPGQSILVEFSNANSADNVTLSINSGTAIPVYYMNTATEQVSGAAIPAGAVVFTLNAAGNKFYAHVTKTLNEITSNSVLPLRSSAVQDIAKKIRLGTYSSEKRAWIRLTKIPQGNRGDKSIFFVIYIGGNKAEHYGKIVIFSINTFYASGTNSTRVRVNSSTIGDPENTAGYYTSIGTDGSIYFQLNAIYGSSELVIEDIRNNGIDAQEIVGYNSAGIPIGFDALETYSGDNKITKDISWGN